MKWSDPSRKIKKKVLIDGIEFSDKEIANIQIDDRITDSSSIQIGSVIANRCDIRLKTDKVIPSNAKVEPYVWLEGEVSSTPLGVFYVDSRSVNNKIIDLICFDKLFLAQKQYATNTSFQLTRYEPPKEPVDEEDDYIPPVIEW